MKNKIRTYRRGVTLVEMLVAMAVTVGVLLAAGTVFEASTKSSGKALALNEVMVQLRTITRQLDRDFAGLMPDMPMVIVAEDDPCDPCSLERVDRIVFFGRGDFQTLDGEYSGNVAQIFYGQSADVKRPANSDKYPEGPWRRVLTRRQKIMHLNGPLPVDDDTWDGGIGGDEKLFGQMGQLDGTNGWKDSTAEEYQYLELENSTTSYWRSKDVVAFHRDNVRVLPGDTGEEVSMLLRPDIGAVREAAKASPAAIGADGMQKLYVLPDVTDFRIELLFAGVNGWFPNERSIELLTDKIFNMFTPSDLWVLFHHREEPWRSQFEMYWNLAGAPREPGAWSYVGQTERQFGAHSDREMAEVWGREVADPAPWPFPADLDPWPRALRFSFRLYDRDRRHFPEGKRFEYVVKLPRKE